MARLRNTKTSGRASAHELIIIDQKVPQAALWSLCQELVPGRRLVGCSDSVFLEKLAHVVGCFEMGNLSIRPNNMRRGGATQLFQDSAVSTSLPTEADGWASAHVAESQGRSSAVGTSALDSLAARAIRCTGQRLQKVDGQQLYRR